MKNWNSAPSQWAPVSRCADLAKDTGRAADWGSAATSASKNAKGGLVEIIAEMKDVVVTNDWASDTDSDKKALAELKDALTKPDAEMKPAESDRDADLLPEWGRHVWSASYQEKLFWGANWRIDIDYDKSP